MPRLLSTLTLLVLVMILAGCGEEKSYPYTHIEWLPFDSVQAAFPAAPKPLFLYISQDGCDHCENMDSLVFSRPEVATFVNENFTPVRVDIYIDLPIFVRDSLLTENEFRKLLSIQGIPAYYFFDPSGRILGVLDSEMDLLTFKRMLVFVRERHFFRTPWNKFMALPEAQEDAIDELF